MSVARVNIFFLIYIFPVIIFSCTQASTKKKKNAREEYFKKVEHFTILEEMAAEAMNRVDTMSDQTYLHNLKKTALVDWTECVNLCDEAKQLDLPPELEENRKQLSLYSNYRIQQTLLFIKAEEEKTDKYKDGIDSIQLLIYELYKEMSEKNELQYQNDTTNLLPLKQL
jgi:hypothetical protein